MFEEKQYLMLPGPTSVPPRVLRALSKPMINHRGPEAKDVFLGVSEEIKNVYLTENDVFIFPSSGTGAMEAAVVNFISPGDRVLAASIGVFGDRFAQIAEIFGAEVEKLDFPWGTAIEPEVIAERLKQDPEGKIKAVFVTHNETSTGVTNNLPAIRKAIGDHPALLIVDAVSSLAAMELRTDDWGLDVVVAGSQKSFMIPPGLSFICVGDKAWQRAEECQNNKYYWDLKAAKRMLAKGQTPYTPALPLLFGLRESLAMIQEEGLDKIIARHRRQRDAVRAAVKTLGLELLAADEVASTAVTAVKAPVDLEANKIRQILLEDFNVVMAGGQRQLENKIFRIGHLGYVQDLDIIAVLAALEMALVRCGVAVQLGSGVQKAQSLFLK